MSQAKRTSSKHASRAATQRTIPGWLWLLTGMVLGGFIMFLVHLSEIKEKEPRPTSSSTSSSPTKKEAPSSKKPIFEFYDRLKQEQVEIPNYSPPTAADTAEAQTHQYFLQVASFRKKEDANTVRAKLILLNLTASIEESKLQSGATAYRVITGPFLSKSKLAKTRDTLVSNGYDYLTLKRPL